MKLRYLLQDIVGTVQAPGKFGYFREMIEAKQELMNVHVPINITTRSLAELLDEIAYRLDAVWEWHNGEKIYISTMPGFGL